MQNRQRIWTWIAAAFSFVVGIIFVLSDSAAGWFFIITGIAFLIVMLSAMLGKSVIESLVILGEMSIHGSLLRVDHLAERLQLAMDNGAKRVLLPAENKRDFGDIPTDLLDKVQIIFYSDPFTAAFRAMDLT